MTPRKMTPRKMTLRKMALRKTAPRKPPMSRRLFEAGFHTVVRPLLAVSR